MSKQINYDPKVTSANTQYNTIQKDDMTWLLKELMRYQALVGELSIHPNEDLQQYIKQWYRKRTKTLPKGKNGLNSPESFISGLLNNLAFGSQNDLSDIQMDAIQNISNNMAQLYDAIIDLKLQSKEDIMLPIMFRQRLFEVVV